MRSRGERPWSYGPARGGQVGAPSAEAALRAQEAPISRIGVLTLEASPFFAEICAGVQSWLGAEVNIICRDSATSTHQEAREIEYLLARGVQGVLVSPVRDGVRNLNRLRDRGIPVVLLDRSGQVSNVCSVAVDDVLGGRLAVAHLIAKGHRRIAIVGGPLSLQQVRDRRFGAALAARMADQRSSRVELTTLTTEALSIKSGRAAGQCIGAQIMGHRPTAIFALNDLLAIGIQQSLLENGIRTPEDVTVIGYDGIPADRSLEILLPTVRQPARLIGEHGARLLCDEIQAQRADSFHRHVQHVLKPTLELRRSSK